MQTNKAKGSLRGKFKRAGWDDAYLSSLIAQIWSAITLADDRSILDKLFGGG